MQILHKTSEVGGRPVALYNLDVVISVGYRVKSFAAISGAFLHWCACGH